MKNADYAKIVGTLRIMEKRLLTSGGLERVAEANSASEAAKAISSNSEHDFSALEKIEDYEEAINANLKKTYAYLYKIAPEPEVLDLALAKYDYHNLKTALKSKYLGKTDEGAYIGYTKTSPAQIVEFVQTGQKPENLRPKLVEAVAAGVAAYEKGGARALDISLDLHMLEYQLGLANKLENEFLTEYMRLAIDSYNISAMARIKSLGEGPKFLAESLCEGGKTKKAELLEGFEKFGKDASVFRNRYFGGMMRLAFEDHEKTGSHACLERLWDNFLLEHIKKSKLVAFGPEILLSYIISKENEAKQIRLVLACKTNNVPPETLKERLRDNYA